MGGTYSHVAETLNDPRRAERIARNIADGRMDPNGALMGPPGRVNADAAGHGQLLASGVNFDRAGFAYDITGYGPFTVNGQTDSTGWSKVGQNANNLRLPIGDLDAPVYIWIWATFGWSLDASSTADHGRVVACLYDSLGTADTPVVRASNPMSNFIPASGNFYEVVYLGFIGASRGELEALGTMTGDEDWNIGLQMQYSGGQKASKTSVNRQSTIAFVSSYPPEGDGNYTVDALLH